jgi:hypothetical protein
MTDVKNTNILHDDIKKIGVWLRWAVPLVLIGIGGIMKYTRDMNSSIQSLIVSDEKLKIMLISTQESLSDKYSRHLGTHEILEYRLLDRRIDPHLDDRSVGPYLDKKEDKGSMQ